MMMRRALPVAAATRAAGTLSAAATLALASCAVGPNYHRPAAPADSDYKEDQGWKPATPGQIPSDQPWWSIYNDPLLDSLERRVEVSNQTLKADEAAYRSALDQRSASIAARCFRRCPSTPVPPAAAAPAASTRPSRLPRARR
jgi:hypothetical protein